MASVSITVRTGSDRYEIDMGYPETMGQAYGSETGHLDRLVDEAVARVKRAYGKPAATEQTP